MNNSYQMCSTCYTIINGVRMTNEEYLKMVRSNARKAKRTKRLNEIKLLPSDIKSAMRNVKVLKSICAYYRHGYKQWGTIARDIINMPQFSSPFLNVVLRTNEVELKINEIETIAKKSDKAVYQYVERLQYILDNLQKHLDDLLYGITKSGVLSSVMQNHECIKGSADGKRLGLQTLVIRGDKAITELGKIIAKLEEITKKGVNPMDYTANGNRVK